MKVEDLIKIRHNIDGVNEKDESKMRWNNENK